MTHPYPYVNKIQQKIALKADPSEILLNSQIDFSTLFFFLVDWLPVNNDFRRLLFVNIEMFD